VRPSLAVLLPCFLKRCDFFFLNLLSQLSVMHIQRKHNCYQDRSHYSENKVNSHFSCLVISSREFNAYE